MRPHRLLALLALIVPNAAPAADPAPIRLANTPSLSPDGATLAFSWAGEIWAVPSEGGLARPLTRHPARDTSPRFSPDGKEIAFVSDREGSNQVFTHAERRVGRPEAGHLPHGRVDDPGLLSRRPVAASSTARADRDWYEAGRLFKVKKEQSEPPRRCSLGRPRRQRARSRPDGKLILFTREDAPVVGARGTRGRSRRRSGRSSRRRRRSRSCCRPRAEPSGRCGSRTARGSITSP